MAKLIIQTISMQPGELADLIKRAVADGICDAKAKMGAIARTELTPNEVRQLAKCSKALVCAAIKSGELRSRNTATAARPGIPGVRHLIHRDEAARWIEQRKEKA